LGLVVLVNAKTTVPGVIFRLLTKISEQ